MMMEFQIMGLKERFAKNAGNGRFGVQCTRTQDGEGEKRKEKK